MPDDTSAPHSDDLHLPWIFVPHGAPEPTEWMAEHPGWIKIPATMVPRGSGNRGLGRRSTSLPPVTLGTTATGLAAPGLIGSGAEGGVATLGEILAGAAAPLAALGILLYPSRTAPPEMDEASPELRRTLGKPPTEALTPPPPSAPLPGLVPPATNQQSSEGFTPSPPTPALPGSIPAASPPPILPGHIAAELSPIILPKERNEGLVGGARTNSPRARKAAEAADPAVTKALKEADWRAHHLINLAGIRQAADLIAEA
jgi:hypothetical protein